MDRISLVIFISTIALLMFFLGWGAGWFWQRKRSALTSRPLEADDMQHINDEPHLSQNNEPDLYADDQ